MAGSATAHGFPTSFLLSPRSTGHFTYLLSSLQIKPKSSNFNLLNTCPLSHLCSSSANGSITDDNFFQQNKNLDVSLSLSHTHILRSSIDFLINIFLFPFLCGIRAKRAKGFGRNGRFGKPIIFFRMIW